MKRGSVRRRYSISMPGGDLECAEEYRHDRGADHGEAEIPRKGAGAFPGEVPSFYSHETCQEGECASGNPRLRHLPGLEREQELDQRGIAGAGVRFLIGKIAVRPPTS